MMRTPLRNLLVPTLAAVGLLAAVGGASAAETLANLAKGLKLDPDQISVSGISSGGFMAHQFHLAHSAHVMGAGIIAGGPYVCSGGTILGAVTRCSQFVMLECKKLQLSPDLCRKTDLSPQDPAGVDALARESLAEARRQAEQGHIDALANLRDDRVFLFSGTHDSIVPRGVMDALFSLYTDPDKLGLKTLNVDYDRKFPAPHTMVRDGFGKPPSAAVGDCRPGGRAFDKNTFIDDCEPVARTQEQQSCTCPAVPNPAAAAGTDCPPDKQLCEDLGKVDLAGAILTRIYGSDALRNGRKKVSWKDVQTFDQRDVFKGFSPTPFTAAQNASMSKEGYLYIPKACKDGRTCRLHVAFHGCLQGGPTGRKIGHTGNLFSQYAGYNEWAEANDIVVLYPQVEARRSGAPLNPQGCWDWWGQDYTHEQFPTQQGRQIKAVARMINILFGGKDLLPATADK